MKEHLSTKCVHTGEVNDAFGSPHTPTYSTTTFKYPSTAAILDVVEGRRVGSLYSRYGLNPSIMSVEEKLASIEQAEAALVFSSGMAAEAATFFALGRKGIACLGDAYGGTLELLRDQLPQLGVKTHLLLGSDLNELETVLKSGVGILFCETPTNPALEISTFQPTAARSAKLTLRTESPQSSGRPSCPSDPFRMVQRQTFCWPSRMAWSSIISGAIYTWRSRLLTRFDEST